MIDQPAPRPLPLAPSPIPFEAIADTPPALDLDPPSQPGSQGRLEEFEILRRIGAGGMGIVFLALATDAFGLPSVFPHRPVALKVLRPELARNLNARAWFLAEAAHLRAIHHPHILPVLKVAEPDVTLPYFVTPHIEGGSLAHLLAGQKHLNPALVQQIARQLAEALRHAHRLGFTHRDVKPANILLRGPSECVLADFGLSASTCGPEPSARCPLPRGGSPPYCSPGVLAGEDEGTRGDIYAFGAVLYEMLAGVPPHAGISSAECIQEVLRQAPRPLRQANPSLSPEWSTLVEGAMGRAMRDRYSEMGDVLADLDRMAAGKTPVGPHG